MGRDSYRETVCIWLRVPANTLEPVTWNGKWPSYVKESSYFNSLLESCSEVTHTNTAAAEKKKKNNQRRVWMVLHMELCSLDYNLLSLGDSVHKKRRNREEWHPHGP